MKASQDGSHRLLEIVHPGEQEIALLLLP